MIWNRIFIQNTNQIVIIMFSPNSPNLDNATDNSSIVILRVQLWITGGDSDYKPLSLDFDEG